MPARREKVAATAASHNAGPPTSESAERVARAHFEALLAFSKRDLPAGQTFQDFERALIGLVFALARCVVALFLCRRHEELDVPTTERLEGALYARAQAQDREIATFFGRVRYWRTYMRGAGGGYYPLDRRLSLPAEGFTLLLVGLVVRIATKISYAQARLVTTCFLEWSPSVTSIERMVLGLGKSTAAWFEQAPVPEDDGDVLVIMIDSKATPTATDHELQKRRGKRRQRQPERSPRHRGRSRRERWQAKRRRKKGDHSKNGRAATLVVMYTLKAAKGPGGRRRLEGPLNRRIYASYARKRHAFAVARREANRRGFARGSGKRIQIVVDGENNFERYAKEFFPEAILTLDVYHAMEYVWKAGRSFHREGSKALADWVKAHKARILDGQIKQVLRELEKRLETFPKTGPGNKGKRSRLKSALTYLAKRVDLMNYGELLDQDLEISTGPAEGAVRFVIGQRFDAAGMRWIPERSEALLQLRCIEVNGDWDAFLRFVEQRAGPTLSVMESAPQALPELGVKPKRKKVA
jgi:hypothetical protein